MSECGRGSNKILAMFWLRMRESNQRLYDGGVIGILVSYSGSLELTTPAWQLRILILSRFSSTTNKNYWIILQYRIWTRNFTLCNSPFKTNQQKRPAGLIWLRIMSTGGLLLWEEGAFGFFKSGKFPNQLNTYPPSQKYNVLG